MLLEGLKVPREHRNVTVNLLQVRQTSADRIYQILDCTGKITSQLVQKPQQPNMGSVAFRRENSTFGFFVLVQRFASPP